jgi:hypothetical protein
MKHLLTAFCSLLLWQQVAAADDTASVGKLFTEVQYTYNWVKYGWGMQTWTCDQKESMAATGSFWVVENGGGLVLVTAGHVLGLNITPEKLGGHKVGWQDPVWTYIYQVNTKVLLGTLAYTPSDIGFSNKVEDVAFLRPKNSRRLKGFKPIQLAALPPKVGETIQVVGYPGTPDPQIDEAKVTSVHEENGFFVLNKGVRPGYSGGVVLNSAGMAYGAITSTDDTDKQTTVLRVTPEMLQDIKWKPANEVLNRRTVP